jgi:hypothetical protein
MKNRNASFKILVGLIFGGLGLMYFFGGTHSAKAPIDNTDTTSLHGLPPDKSGSVSVTDQEAGMSVRVESVTVPPPGVWVAIREVEGTTLGNILGAARARGPASQVAVPLLRETQPLHTYAVQLFRDDGDNEFSQALDSVYVDFDTGLPVIAPFSTF